MPEGMCLQFNSSVNSFAPVHAGPAAASSPATAPPPSPSLATPALACLCHLPRLPLSSCQLSS